MNINSVTVIGNITHELELRVLPNGTMSCQFNVAVNGYQKEDVSYFMVKAFGKSAENIKKHCDKGSKICITGSLKQERWENQNGKQSKVVIICERCEFL